MRKSKLTALAAFCGVCLASSPSISATVVDGFQFLDGSTVVASGSFSYSSSLSGDLGYSNLNTFSITVAGQTYNLGFVNSLSPSSGDFVYFDYNTVSKSFVPGSVSGTYWNGSSFTTGTFSGLLAATGFAGSTGPLTQGFFFDPLIGMADPAGTGADGLYTEYSTNTASQLATSLVIAPIASAVPETSTWIMILLGFAGLGFVSYRRKPRPALMAA